MYQCMTCKNKFEKPKKKGSLSLIWIIIIFFSMGLGIILWILTRKKVCPYCSSETFVDTKFLQK